MAMLKYIRVSKRSSYHIIGHNYNYHQVLFLSITEEAQFYVDLVRVRILARVRLIILLAQFQI